MELTVIGSGSSGNAYVLQNEGEALLLEAGMPFKQTLASLGGKVEKVKGVLITHEHGDHAGRISEPLSYALPVYASQGTIDATKIRGNWKPKPIAKTEDGYEQLQLGGFTVIPFGVKHDAAEPLGFYIWHEETGGILFATDTYYLPCTFVGLSNVMIECNYDPNILQDNVEAGIVPPALKERVRRSHLSYYTCLEALRANDLSAVNNIVLIHLSEGNGDAPAFREGIAKATGKTVHVAKAGLTIRFNKTPF